jgi:hypothetical protein
MAANPFFSGRIPQELFDHIEKRIEKSGESKTDILVQALAIYTGFDLPIQKEITQSPALVSSNWRLESLQYKRFNKAGEFGVSPPKLTLFQ